MLRHYISHIITLDLAICNVLLDRMAANPDLANFVLRQAQDEREFIHTL
jgi:hypothetical protein